MPFFRQRLNFLSTNSSTYYLYKVQIAINDIYTKGKVTFYCCLEKYASFTPTTVGTSWTSICFNGKIITNRRENRINIIFNIECQFYVVYKTLSLSFSLRATQCRLPSENMRCIHYIIHISMITIKTKKLSNS